MKQTEDFDRDPQNYKKRQKKTRIYGIILALFGIVIIIDYETPFPIPLVGITAFVIGGLCVIIGLYLIIFKSTSSPSSRMIMFIAEKYQGLLTSQILVRDMSLDFEEAEHTLSHLYKSNYLAIFNKKTASDSISEIVFKFIGVSSQPAKQNQVPETKVSIESSQSDLSADQLNNAILTGSLTVGPSGIGIAKRGKKS